MMEQKMQHEVAQSYALARRPQPQSFAIQPYQQVRATTKKVNHWFEDHWVDVIGPCFALLVILARWSTVLPAVHTNQMGELGLLSVLPFTIFAALLILTLSFCLAVQQPTTPTPILWLHIVLFIVIVHGTPALTYDSLRYSWAWKHVGIIDYIQRQGGVNLHVGSLEIYHRWPGFFAVNALLTDLTGAASALNYAAWAPVFFNLLIVWALLLIFQTQSTDQRLVWQAVWFFTLTNWIGQDYFSPQAMNYFLHLVIVGLALRWFYCRTIPSQATLYRWVRSARVTRWLYQGAQWLTRHDRPPVMAEAPSPAAAWLIILLLFTVVVSSHQLTPFITILTVGLLVCFQRCRTRLLPVVMIVMVGCWLLFVGGSEIHQELWETLDSFGKVTTNVTSNLVDVEQAPASQQFVSFIARLLTVGVWLLALEGMIQLWRMRRWNLPFTLAAIAPFLMLLGSAYGGEIIFRVYFFALPFMAYFMAGVLFASTDDRYHWRTFCLNLLLSVLLLTGFMVAYYGKEQMYHFSRAEVDAGSYVQNIAVPNTLLIEGSRNYPSRFHNYEYFTYVAISREPAEAQKAIDADPVGSMKRWMSNPDYAAAYLIITRSQKAEMKLNPETLPQGALERMEQALTASPDFRIIFANEDATVFALASRWEGGQ
jgi:hypothetical protein